MTKRNWRRLTYDELFTFWSENVLHFELKPTPRFKGLSYQRSELFAMNQLRPIISF